MFDLTTCPSCLQYCPEIVRKLFRLVRPEGQSKPRIPSPRGSKEWTAYKYLYSITQIASTYLRTPNGSNHTAPLRAMDLADVTRKRRHRFRNVQPRSLHEPAYQQITLPSIHARYSLLIVVRRISSVRMSWYQRLPHIESITYVNETPTKSYTT